MNQSLSLTHSVSSVRQLFWHSDPFTPGFALEQLKKTIGSAHADDNDSVLQRTPPYAWCYSYCALLQKEYHDELSALYLHSLVWLPVQLSFPLWQELKYIERQVRRAKKRNEFYC